MSITTEQKALEKMIPNGGMTIEDIINYFVNNGIFTEEECKDRIKEDFPNVTDWSF